jgi:hypothetical protein
LVYGLHFDTEDVLIIILGIGKFSRPGIAHPLAVDLLVQKVSTGATGYDRLVVVNRNGFKIFLGLIALH